MTRAHHKHPFHSAEAKQNQPLWVLALVAYSHNQEKESGFKAQPTDIAPIFAGDVQIPPICVYLESIFTCHKITILHKRDQRSKSVSMFLRVFWGRSLHTHKSCDHNFVLSRETFHMSFVLSFLYSHDLKSRSKWGTIFLILRAVLQACLIVWSRSVHLMWISQTNVTSQDGMK